MGSTRTKTAAHRSTRRVNLAGSRVVRDSPYVVAKHTHALRAQPERAIVDGKREWVWELYALGAQGEWMYVGAPSVRRTEEILGVTLPPLPGKK